MDKERRSSSSSKAAYILDAYFCIKTKTKMASIKNEETYHNKKGFLEKYRIKLKAITDDALKHLSAQDDNFSTADSDAKKANYFQEIDNCVSVALSETNQWNYELRAIAEDEKTTIHKYERNNLKLRIRILERRVRFLQESMERREQQRLLQRDEIRFAKSCLGG